ncbi:MAG: Asp-tRNA(Asn)/Glu-tRNA(Gln) amidotransferase subunit GatC [Chloroflexi bacterium]|nr:MAG: Aspartyl/glutamyl-tRNA(Asn/Gln) amidotransferase subunit C [bacterium 42_11]MBC7239425.1 Asp-tRNA(Asn)/Glu-tRNA(Gln) amidotransferase subunit GatC [Chloroflexota bacterium]MBC7331725.1 Asp-tRNA(Asn)/Glu-tRNA(Gln) amidotransferase subunit GatC [Synergistota bacterium]MDK2870752.1 aspartyl-tRNA(Asn)/glutamyl-tRNA(Gln) amidotransferase subunit [bacterium]
MRVTIKDVKHIMKLAYLDLKGEEEEKMLKHFSRILEYFAKLQELDTANIEPLSHVIEESTPLREDEVKKGLSQRDVLSMAPEEEGGYVKVPKIVE